MIKFIIAADCRYSVEYNNTRVSERERVRSSFALRVLLRAVLRAELFVCMCVCMLIKVGGDFKRALFQLLILLGAI